MLKSLLPLQNRLFKIKKHGWKHPHEEKLHYSEIKYWKKLCLSGTRTHDLKKTGAEVMVSNPVRAWFFSRLKFLNCLNYVYNCNDQSNPHIFLCSSNMWSFLYSLVQTDVCLYVCNIGEHLKRHEVKLINCTAMGRVWFMLCTGFIIYFFRFVGD